jgi:hypothetical protein
MEEILPNALMIGITYDLFWELDPLAMVPFTKAFELKLKFMDTEAWRNGLYIKLAIASSFDKKTKYPESPLSSKKVNKIMSPEDIKAKMFVTASVINGRLGKE